LAAGGDRANVECFNDDLLLAVMTKRTVHMTLSSLTARHTPRLTGRFTNYCL